MAYSIKIKKEAEKLRRKGHSYNEIHEKMGIAKGTLSRWFKDLKLSDKAMERLESRIQKGQIIAGQTKRRQTKKRNKRERKQANDFIDSLNISSDLNLLLCSLIYICEGESSPNNRVGFSNSDPKLVKTFLNLFRKSFDIKEEKFRVMLHLHDYHNKKEQKKFWSDVTNIPSDQFLKVHQKEHTKIRTREGYPGCAHIRYYDTKIARKLVFTAEAFLREGA